MTIELVSVADIDARWALVAPLVANCLRKAPMEITVGDVWTNCRMGQWLLLLAHDGQHVYGMSVWRFSATRLFECVLLAGKNMKEWAPEMIGAAKAIALANECAGLCASGRPGLIKEIRKSLPGAKIVRHTFAMEF